MPDDKLRLLKKNYDHLFDLYRRGRFEIEADPHSFTFFGPAPAPPPAGVRKRVRTIKPAADDLYLLAESLVADPGLGRLPPDLREEVAEMVLRAQVLSYEIDDYFLNIDPSKSKDYVDRSKNICDDLPAYFERHYGFISDQKRQKRVVQYLLLAALCGVNELYRRHNKDDYKEGIRWGEQLLAYIRDELPHLPSPPTSGRGVLGLCCYIMGRLYFASAAYQRADAYFRESVEAYSQRIQINQGETLESILATVRRCALASTFGNAYIALVDGKVHDALTLSALACSVLKHNCGEVYAAYAELIYWTAKRAEASSDGPTLRKVHRSVRRCRRVFKLYVPDTHYVHRAGVELGIAYHYLAVAEPHRRDRYYNLATTYLKQAIAFAGAEAGGRPRNQRMLAEALVVLSHISINCDPEKVDAAMRLAEKAQAAAKGIDQFACEANLALAAICSVAAQRSPSPEQKAEYILGARMHANKALEINRNTNALIQAAGYLRLAELSLLRPNTMPEVRHYYERWLGIKNLVEHEVVRRWGDRIKDALLDVNEHLFIDVSDSIKYKDWKTRVEEHLANAAMRELAGELRADEGAEPREGAGPVGKSGRTRHPSHKTLIKDYLVRKFGVERATAYDWIKRFKLEEKLREYLY